MSDENYRTRHSEMKAIAKTSKTQGVALLDVEIPKVGATDILVKVHACSLCGSDLHIYEWRPGYEWLPTPLILGHEFAGEIVDVGGKVERAAVGDAH